MTKTFIDQLLARFRQTVTFDKVRASIGVALSAAALTVTSAATGVGDWKALAYLTAGSAASAFTAYWRKEFSAYGFGLPTSAPDHQNMQDWRMPGVTIRPESETDETQP